jgi:hypothetical protein
MSTSFNESILKFAVQLDGKTRYLLQDVNPFIRVLCLPFIYILYLTLLPVFFVYAFLFFSDELMDRLIEDKYYSNYEDLVRTKNAIAPFKTRPKLFKAIRLFFDFLRVFGKSLKWAPAICLVVGLIQMMEYEATLDTVRGIDFKLIARSIEGRDLESEEDVVAIKSTINALTSRSGRALFPVAILSKGSCFENGSTNRLCNLYASQEDFANEKLKSDMGFIYGSKSLRAEEGGAFIFSELSDGKATLLGEAGAYALLGRAAFLDKMPYYLIGPGLKKMYSKSQYIWWVICVATFISFMVKEIAIKRNRLRWKKARVSLLLKDREARKSLDELNKVRAKAQLVESELEEHRNVSDSLIRDFSKKLKKARARENEAEELYYETLKSYEEKVADAKKEDGKLTSVQAKHALEERTIELDKIKRLWTYDYGWSDRLEIERDITAQGSSPFIRNVSFVGFEMFIKKFARQKLNYSLSRLKAYDGPTVRDLIDELAEANMISEKDKMFFHEVRAARNNWMHELKLPSDQLLKRLVNILEKSNPVTRPVL